MENSTENNYQETDLGNVSPNPRGEYDSTAEYEYLDLVSYKGGSYLCTVELGETVTNVSPAAGKKYGYLAVTHVAWCTYGRVCCNA